MKKKLKKGNRFVFNVEVDFIPLHNLIDVVEDLLRPQEKEIIVPESALFALISKVLSVQRIHNLSLQKCIKNEVATGDNRCLYKSLSIL